MVAQEVLCHSGKLAEALVQGGWSMQECEEDDPDGHDEDDEDGNDTDEADPTTLPQTNAVGRILNSGPQERQNENRGVEG